MDYPSLLNLSNNGIVALVNHTSKSVYVMYSVDMLLTISRNLRLLKDGTHSSIELQRDYRNFVLEVPFCSNESLILEELKAMYNVCLKAYTDQGYTDLRNGYTPGSYKLKAYVKPDYRKNHGNKLLAYVYAISNRRSKIVLGVFEHMDEAKAYIAELRPSPDSIVVPKRHTNELTVRYFKRLVKERGR